MIVVISRIRHGNAKFEYMGVCDVKLVVMGCDKQQHMVWTNKVDGISHNYYEYSLFHVPTLYWAVANRLERFLTCV